MSVPALGIAPVADEKVHADPTDSIGRSALMTQLTKPADEMLQVRFMKFGKKHFIVQLHHLPTSNRSLCCNALVSFATLVE